MNKLYNGLSIKRPNYKRYKTKKNHKKTIINSRYRPIEKKYKTKITTKYKSAKTMKSANIHNKNGYVTGGGNPEILNNSTNNINSNSNNNNSNNSKNQCGKLFKHDKKNGCVYRNYNINDDSTFNKNPKRCMCINYKSINDLNTYDRCINNAINGSDFCQLHQDCKSYLRQFLSGSEYPNDIEIWKDPLVEGSHNCYSYFLNRQVKAVREECEKICKTKYKSIDECIDASGCSDLKPQPYDFTLIKNNGSDKNKERIYKCPQMQEKILADNPSLIPVDFNYKCPHGYYKGAMVVDSLGSNDGNTYHVDKQIADGRFLHKPGINPISTNDAPFEKEKGRPIYIPHFANRDYSKKNNNNNNGNDESIFYNGFCGYYCIPRNEREHKNLM